MILFIAPRLLSPFADRLECATHVSTPVETFRPAQEFRLLTSHNGCAVTKTYRHISANLLFTYRELLTERPLFTHCCGASFVSLALRCCPLKIGDRPTSDNPTIVLRECDPGRKSALTCFASCVFSAWLHTSPHRRAPPTTAIAAALQPGPSRHYTKDAGVFDPTSQGKNA